MMREMRIEEMGKHGISPFDHDPGELEEELREITVP
jgi:hypothetical protein